MIKIKSREECLGIGRSICSKQGECEDYYLFCLPDEVFGTIAAVKANKPSAYLTYSGWMVPKEFADIVYDCGGRLS